MPPCGPPKPCPPPPPWPPCAYAGAPLRRNNAAISAVSRTNLFIDLLHSYDAPAAKPDAHLAANRQAPDRRMTGAPGAGANGMTRIFGRAEARGVAFLRKCRAGP